jgi:quercetin dioxygenase-like cupin family protein
MTNEVNMNPYAYTADLATLIPEIPPDSILSRTFYEDEQLKAIVFAFAAGQELSEHTASHPAIHILRGEADLTLGGDSKAGVPGTWIHMAAHLPHTVVARTPVIMLLLMLKS